MKPCYPEEVEEVFKKYDQTYGLETEGLWFVTCGWGGYDGRKLFQGKLRTVLQTAMDHFDFFNQKPFYMEAFGRLKLFMLLHKVNFPW